MFVKAKKIATVTLRQSTEIMSTSSFPATPAARLSILSLAGVLMAAAMVIWALQPANGPTGNLANWRALTDLPAGFWVGWTVGFGAWLISAWVFSLRPSEPAVILFATSGAMTLMFTFASTPSMVAMPVSESVAKAGVILNGLGASGFGIAMICLFAIYPRALPAAKWICGTALLGFTGWTVSILFGPKANPAIIQLITLIEMLVIMALALWQVLRPHHDPAQRAIAIWLGVSVLFGAGPFIGLVALPLSFGFPNLIDENLAFSSFLLIYLGLALGLVRYRLFELGTWAYRLLFYAGAACAVLALDVALMSVLAMTPTAAFTTTLLIIAFTWLPLRDFVWKRFTQRTDRNEAKLFASVATSVLQPTAEARATGWQAVLQDLFEPLELTQSAHAHDQVQLSDDGQILYVPAVIGGPPLTLRHAKAGQALFTRRDSDLAQQFVLLATRIDQSRDAYDQGVSEERTRIARDIHDNIGAHLMRALHSDQSIRKDAMIRETLSDLRDIINNAATPGLHFETVMSDLRAETADRLEPHTIALAWEIDVAETIQPSQALLQMVRAVIREATSNAIKHAKPTQFGVKLMHKDQTLLLNIEDNGKGMDTNLKTKGHGLDNMRGRFASLGGNLTLSSDEKGTHLTAFVPLSGLEPHEEAPTALSNSTRISS